MTAPRAALLMGVVTYGFYSAYRDMNETKEFLEVFWASILEARTAELYLYLLRETGLPLAPGGTIFL